MNRRKGNTSQIAPASGGNTFTYTISPDLTKYQQAVNRLAWSATTSPKFFGGGALGAKTQPFSGREFAMGAAAGVRSWNVDELGRLVSPSYPMVWPPTEVEATCRRREVDVFTWTPSLTSYDDPTEPEPVKAHSPATCSCGFYAYYQGFNEYADNERVTGVIEGYGEVQIGTRGFKAQKARIVALHVPTDIESPEKHVGISSFERVRRNYGKHIPIFDTYAEMAAEFPATAPDGGITPETDPDFWTRGI